MSANSDSGKNIFIQNGRNIFITDAGKKKLGEFLKENRLLQDIRLEDLNQMIVERTSYSVCSLATLSKLEHGIMRHDPNLISAIAVVLQIPNPKTNAPYTPHELEEIARENLDPYTGNWIDHTKKKKAKNA